MNLNPILTASALLMAVAFPTIAALAPASDFAISQKGPHHRVWTKTAQEKTPKGKTINRVHSYEEWATGMHYWSDELKDWVESTDQVEIINGFAVARHGQLQIIWSPNCNTAGAVDMQSTLDGKRFRSHVLGLAFTDAKTGASVFFANLKDSIGEVVGSQVIYRDAFDSILGDILYSYTRNGFEQNIVLRQDVPDPSQPPWNMDPATVRIEVYTEFIEPPTPAITPIFLKQESDPAKRAAMVEPDFLDQQLDFSATQIGSGAAFLTGAADDREKIPVAKPVEVREGRHVLIEKVEYASLKNQLAVLQRAAVVPKERMAKINADLTRDWKGIRKSRLPVLPTKTAKLKTEAIRTAQLIPKERALVIDYSQISTMTNATLKCDSTIYIAGTVTLSGTSVVEGGVVVKFAPTNSASLQFNGPVTCLTGPYRVATFTARDDTSIGEAIGTNALSGFYATTAIDLKGAYARDLKYFRIAYANVAVGIESDAGARPNAEPFPNSPLQNRAKSAQYHLRAPQRFDLRRAH